MARARTGGALAAVGIDIPIGLSDTRTREADLLARRLIGGRRSSVFLTPVRAALEVDDYATASRISRELTGAGISIQAYSLRRKILEVDGWLPGAGCRVVEVHPEVSFARMAGRPLPDSKTTWAGTEHRRALLAGVGIELAGELGEAGRAAGVDDVLDAGAAAWSARRVAGGEAISLPDPPELVGIGVPAAIWV